MYVQNRAAHRLGPYPREDRHAEGHHASANQQLRQELETSGYPRMGGRVRQPGREVAHPKGRAMYLMRVLDGAVSNQRANVAAREIGERVAPRATLPELWVLEPILALQPLLRRLVHRFGPHHVNVDRPWAEGQSQHSVHRPCQREERDGDGNDASGLTRKRRRHFYIAAQCDAPISLSGARASNDVGSSAMRPRGASGSSTGTALSKARVYGCLGLENSVCVLPISTILPRYITATRSQMFSTRRRSWAMNRYVSL